MQIRRHIQNYPITKSNYEPGKSYLDWPFDEIPGNRLIVACNICFYPITLEKYIINEIRDTSNISFGIITPTINLLNEFELYHFDSLEQWRTRVFCPNCGIILSFVNPIWNCQTDENFAKIRNYTNNKDIVILWTFALYRGSNREAYSCFEQMKKFL